MAAGTVGGGTVQDRFRYEPLAERHRADRPAPRLVSEQPRTYAHTIEVWKTSCPRLSVWEDALADQLVRIDHGYVLLTAAGSELLTARPRP